MHKLSGTWPKLLWSASSVSNELHPSNEGSSFKLRASDNTLRSVKRIIEWSVIKLITFDKTYNFLSFFKFLMAPKWILSTGLAFNSKVSKLDGKVSYAITLIRLLETKLEAKRIKNTLELSVKHWIKQFQFTALATGSGFSILAIRIPTCCRQDLCQNMQESNHGHKSFRSDQRSYITEFSIREWRI